MKPNELRVGNWVINKNGDYHEVTCNCFQKFRYPTMDGNPSGFKPIPLTPEILEKAGFSQLPHKTVQNTWRIKMGRRRFLSVSCVGTPNEMVFITEEAPPEVKSIIVAKNFDFDGKTYLHQLQNLYYSLTGEELNIEL